MGKLKTQKKIEINTRKNCFRSLAVFRDLKKFSLLFCDVNFKVSTRTAARSKNSKPKPKKRRPTRLVVLHVSYSIFPRFYISKVLENQFFFLSFSSYYFVTVRMTFLGAFFLLFFHSSCQFPMKFIVSEFSFFFYLSMLFFLHVNCTQNPPTTKKKKRNSMKNVELL